MYTLHLLGKGDRFYKVRQSTKYLEKFGYIEPTGRASEKGDQFEYTITEKGRAALVRFKEA